MGASHGKASEVEKARLLASQGRSLRQIGKELRRNPTTVGRWVKDPKRYAERSRPNARVGVKKAPEAAAAPEPKLEYTPPPKLDAAPDPWTCAGCKAILDEKARPAHCPSCGARLRWAA